MISIQAISFEINLRKEKWLVISIYLRYLAFEVFKSIMHLTLQFMWSYFEEKPMPYKKTVSIKNCQSLNVFKLELKNLENIPCTCLVCR